MCCSPDLYRSDDYVVMVTSFNDFANVPGQAGSDGMSAEWRTGAFKTVGGQMKFQTKHAGVLDFGGARPPTVCSCTLSASASSAVLLYA